MGDKKSSVNVLQVQSTNDASIVSKCSMANSNYVKDDFVKYFVQKEKLRASLMHLGYYTRAIIISEILTRFIRFLHCQKIPNFQIINCGAGFDTTYWRLAHDELLNENSIYVEIDYPDVINRKFTLIKESEKLCKLLNIPENDEIVQVKKLNTNYFLIGADLCDLETIENLLRRINVDFDIPTLFLSECAITYMKSDDSDKLLKWMTETFSNCGLLNYEQIHPEDGFGTVMMGHFNKLQSTLHSVLTYSDCNSHRKRYHSLGFESSVVMSEWEFFVNLTDLEDRKRIQALEQFDEFEEFHLKCTHYVAGLCGNNILSGFTSEMDYSCDCLTEEVSSFRIEKRKNGLELFGHSSCETRGKILIFGGFSPGGRSKKVRTFNNWNIGEIQVPGGENVRFDAVHGCVMSFELDGKFYVGMYGGRTSPNSVINNGDFIIFEHCLDHLKIHKIFPCEGGPKPRYRTSIVSHSCGQNEVSAWIFGGRTADIRETLSDFWQLIIHLDGVKLECKWVKIERELAPCGRMSHSAAVCSLKNYMYITCGLDTRNFTVLNDIWKWSFTRKSWEEVRPRSGRLIPRYGHTSHIQGNVLYMVGGVNTDAGRQPGLTIFDLDTLHLAEYSVESFRTEPILLFNHSSAIIGDDDENCDIVVFGGGGNCFSFGTYFNKGVHSISFEACRLEMIEGGGGTSSKCGDGST